MAKFNREDVLIYGEDRYFIIDVVTDLDSGEYYLCCYCSPEAELDFTDVEVFDITLDENNEEMIRMVNPESDIFKDVLLSSLDSAMLDLVPEYKDKVEELLELEGEE